MPESDVLLESLDLKFSELALAEGPSDVFRIVLEGAALAAPRVAMFLVRQGRVKGWSCAGYPADAARKLRALSVAVGEGWLGRPADPALEDRSEAGDEGGLPDFGQPRADEAAAYALRVGGKALAVLVIERRAGEPPWAPGAVGALRTIAQIRLELDLARRKLARLVGDAGASEGEPSGAPGPARPAEDTETALEPADGEAGRVASAAPADDPAHAAARRFARLVATDIRLYNEEAVMLGRRNRDLLHRIKEHLDRGRETFERRFPDLGEDGAAILRDAYVQVLAGGDAELLPADAVA